MNVVQIRELIPVCNNTIYVNSAWSGPSPMSVVGAIKSRLDVEMDLGPTTPEVQQSGRMIATNAREQIAKLLNTTVEEICLTRNTTEGLNIVMNGLVWHPGDEIITFDIEHSSVLVPCFYQQQRHGAVVKVVPLSTNATWDRITSDIEAAITERTRLIFFSHIQWSSGLRMPIQDIRKITKDRNILLLLDGAQTAGQISLDMNELDCDFYSIPGQKWLLGPEGTGALYIRKDLIQKIEPTHVANKAILPVTDFTQFKENETTMEKFLLTSTSAALQAGMLEAINFVQKVGVQEIEQRNLSLASTLKQSLKEIPGVHILSPTENHSSSGLVSFTIDNVEPAAAVSYFWDRHKIVARQISYPPCIRVSLHFFNTEEEVRNVTKAILELV